MDLDLKGKFAFVSGGTMGIGRAIAAALLAEGARVAIAARRADRLADALALLPGATGIAADLASAQGSAEVASWLAAQGPVDILVHNVGAYPDGNLATPDDDWRDLFDLNVMSAVRLTRPILPAMLARNRGRIIFIASEQSLRPNPDSLPYSVTKAAQLSLARGLAETTKGTSVTVNTILVGPVWTEGAAAYYGQVEGEPPRDDALAYFAGPSGQTSLAGRYARPEEIASAVAFVASGAASYVNGAAIRVDGGILATMA